MIQGFLNMNENSTRKHVYAVFNSDDEKWVILHIKVQNHSKSFLVDFFQGFFINHGCLKQKKNVLNFFVLNTSDNNE